MRKVIFNYKRAVNKSENGVITINENNIIIFMRTGYNIGG